MHSSQSHNFNGNDTVAEMKKSRNNVSNIFKTLRKGLRAAAAAQVCPNDKEAILRMVSED